MHNLLERFIRRPVLTTALSVLLLLLGLFALTQMPLQLFPNMPLAIIDISTSYAGASADTIQSFVTSKIQSAIVGVDGIDYITSSSTPGTSDIQVFTQPGEDVDTILTAILEKVNSVQGLLPTGTKPPIIQKENRSNYPILILGFTSKQWSRLRTADYLTRIIEPELEAIDGVSQAEVWSNGNLAMQIWLNPLSLTAYQLTPQ